MAAPPSLHRQGLLATLHDAWPTLALTLTPDAAQLPALLRQQAFALLILDGSLSGPQLPELLDTLRRARSQQPMLVLTGQRLPPSMRQALQCHVALLPRHTTPQEVIAAVRPWLNGASGGSISPVSSFPARHHAPPTPFSRRELEVLRLVVDDHCNQEIAEQLCLSVRTVESHRRALLQKTGARTLVGLVVQAMREGWVAA
ncbi:hypothetical protein B0919_13755 [Hymenobacter sp. CRA2]|nr:hypothetical protein B0919_13755 [Hymenobacter sp. CRA2]